MTNAGDAEYFASLTGDNRPVCAMAREVMQLRADLATRDARIAELEGALQEQVHSHDGFHTEDCGAMGANDSDVCTPDGECVTSGCGEPHCGCGTTKKRNEARAALAGKGG